MKFLDNLYNMNNYFQDTPVYKIWCDVISILSKKSSFVFLNSPYSFSKIICQREELRAIFLLKDLQLELIYAHENRVFFCLLSNINTQEALKWKLRPPKINTLNSFEDLEIEIDCWIDFLKRELPDS